MRKDQWIAAGLIVTLIVLVGVGLWKTSGRRGPERITVIRTCQDVMGTTCSIAAVVDPDGRARAEEVLQRAEAVLRSAEARMSTWLNDSELGRFNAAAAGQQVPLSPESLEVLRIARRAAAETGGAFDVTCRPVIELWREAPGRGAVPTQSELSQARAESGWDLILLKDTGAVKLAPTARVDLGGIAKGYAVDRAVEVLRRAGLAGGLVDVGGDLVCFGRPRSGETWPVEVNSPFGADRLARLRLPGGAVCSSGNYARFNQIAGKRYSHIIDPRTGRPADAVFSVTVVARDAVTADIWATALSVLGSEGFQRLPEGVEAMIVTGTKEDHQTHRTPGFRSLLEEPVAP